MKKFTDRVEHPVPITVLVDKALLDKFDAKHGTGNRSSRIALLIRQDVTTPRKKRRAKNESDTTDPVDDDLDFAR